MKETSPLERAIEYIENHLNENISLSDVSKETGYSYYHMTGLFSSVLGESVGRYINRRRLYNASKKLVHSDQRVIDIALDCGFESPEGFSRAFKAVFGSSPVDYRKAGLDLMLNAKRELVPEDVGHIANNISRSPEFVMLEETKVVGLRGTTSLSDNRLPGLWEEFLRFHKDLFVAAGAGYGICETQRTAYTKDGDVSFSYMVGSPVYDFDDLPSSSPLEQKVLRAGDTPFSPTVAPLQTCPKRTSTFLGHGCKPQKQSWTTGRTLRFMSGRRCSSTTPIMRLKFIFR